MVAYVTATFKGGGDLPFTKGQPYSLAVMKHWWSKKLHVYKRRGYYDEMQEVTLHHFETKDDFFNHWEVKEGELHGSTNIRTW